MATVSSEHTVAQHLAGREPAVKATYRAIVKAARELGPVHEEPKKTSIHLARKTAFAGVSMRKTALILTLKLGADLASPRVARREQASANRWHVEIRLESPAEIDRELIGWLKQSYALSA